MKLDYIPDGQMSIFDFLETAKPQKPLIEQIKETEILKGSGFVGGKKRILDFFGGSHNIQEEGLFLRQEYGTGGWSIRRNNQTIGFCNHESKGMIFEFNEKIENQESVLVQWSMVAKYIRCLIEEGRYIA